VPTRIAVLASGGGSNLGAIFSHLDALGDARGGEVVLVASDRAGAGALGRAAARAVRAVYLDEPSHGRKVDDVLREHDIGLVVLSGYLRLVPDAVTRRFRGRIMNVHPALLPAFGGPGMYGLRAHRAVLETGASVSGASVHFVDEAYDRGPLIVQWPVPVIAGDTPEALAARVLRVEHLLYPRAVDAVAAGRITLGDDNRARRGTSTGGRDAAFALINLETDSLAKSIDLALGR
jgi:formyltetrahydrofolate-dependent phosphoribosylglycinamide formyltransferase